MQILERNKSEVQAKAEKMSDFLRMEYLENCTKKFMDKEILRYCFQELSRLYERNAMYPDAIKYLAKYEEISVTNREKIQAYLKEIELLVKAGLYDRIEFAHKKAKDIATPKEINEINEKIIQLLKDEGAKYDRLNKYTPATKAYEKLLQLLRPEEKTEIKKRLVFLYNKLGRVRESIELERELQR
jgi:tetratricopeptide (TPR) repeat protein